LKKKKREREKEKEKGLPSQEPLIGPQIPFAPD